MITVKHFLMISISALALACAPKVPATFFLIGNHSLTHSMTSQMDEEQVKVVPDGRK